MSNEFMREERYIVFKLTDLGNSLKGDEIRQLAREYAEQRRLKGKKPLNCLVVESDWPEFEPTWGAIAARVAGAQPAPSFADAYQGAMEEVAIWKKRALEAEDLNRKFVAEINGPMLMGEPVAQPAPKAVAYLDLGVGGYTDIGTDLTDEELATLPKGRHMLGVIGTYGVDGYVSAQLTPSVPDGWLERGLTELENIRNRFDDSTLMNDKTLIERLFIAMTTTPEDRP